MQKYNIENIVIRFNILCRHDVFLIISIDIRGKINNHILTIRK